MTHYGAVTLNAREARVNLTVHGDNGTSEGISYIVDTGATVAMVLPQETIDRRNLPPADDADIAITMADGAIDHYNLYIATALWHSRLREIEVVNLVPDPLIGVDLLQGSNRSVDAAPGGLVTITEQPAPS